MLKMFDQLGTADSLKHKVAFNDIEDHVLTASLSTDEYEDVAFETIRFLKRVLND